MVLSHSIVCSWHEPIVFCCMKIEKLHNFVESDDSSDDEDTREMEGKCYTKGNMEVLLYSCSIFYQIKLQTQLIFFIVVCAAILVFFCEFVFFNCCSVVPSRLIGPQLAMWVNIYFLITGLIFWLILVSGILPIINH